MKSVANGHLIVFKKSGKKVTVVSGLRSSDYDFIQATQRTIKITHRGEETDMKGEPLRAESRARMAAIKRLSPFSPVAAVAKSIPTYGNS